MRLNNKDETTPDVNVETPNWEKPGEPTNSKLIPIWEKYYNGDSEATTLSSISP